MLVDIELDPEKVQHIIISMQTTKKLYGNLVEDSRIIKNLQECSARDVMGYIKQGVYSCFPYPFNIYEISNELSLTMEGIEINSIKTVNQFANGLLGQNISKNLNELLDIYYTTEENFTENHILLVDFKLSNILQQDGYFWYAFCKV